MAELWGGITGTLSDQTDLQAALDLKADVADAITSADLDAALLAERSATGIISNKRLKRRVIKIVSGTSITIDGDNTDIYCITALAANATINEPTGTPLDGDTLLLRITDNGTTRTLTWNAAFRACGVTLPAHTVAWKILVLGFLYDTDNGINKWMCIGGAQEE